MELLRAKELSPYQSNSRSSSLRTYLLYILRYLGTQLHQVLLEDPTCLFVRLTDNIRQCWLPRHPLLKHNLKFLYD